MSDLKHSIKLVSMELSNFKSFSKFANINQDAHIVGPFTNFTGIVGPNGVGKSNIFDAVAFALNLSLAPGKVRHTRELANRLNLVANGDNDSKNQDSQDSFEFFVKLNFLKINSETNKQEKLSIQRGLKRQPETGSYFNEYIVNEDHERPLLYEEYKKLLDTVYHLDIQQFIVFQSQLDQLCFSQNSSQKLVQTFEKLSGSIQFKESFDTFKSKIHSLESDLKSLCENLKELRHEKIKIKGLSDFQNQIDECI